MLSSGGSMRSASLGESRSSGRHRGRLLTYCVVLFVRTQTFSQESATSFIDDEDEFTSAAAAAEELERLRIEPLDLRHATIEDLMLIPGITRRAAAAIAAGVRSGRIVSLDDVDRTFGVRQGTGDLLRPFIILAPIVPVWEARSRTIMTGSRRSIGNAAHMRLRQLATWKLASFNGDRRGSEFELSSDRSLKSENPAFSLTGFLRAYPENAWEVGVGWMQVRTGMSLGHSGSRSSLMEPASWNRSFNGKAQVRSMSRADGQSNIRGFSLARSWENGSLLSALGTSSDRETVRSVLASEMGFDAFTSRTAFVYENRYSRNGVFIESIGFGDSSTDVALEAQLPLKVKGAPSLAGFASLDATKSLELSGLVRILRGTGRIDIPSAFHGARPEEGGSFGMRGRLGSSWSVVGMLDRFRMLDPANSEVGWSCGSGAMVAVSMRPIPRSVVTAQLRLTERRVATREDGSFASATERRKRWAVQANLGTPTGIHWAAGVQAEKKSGIAFSGSKRGWYVWTEGGWRGDHVQVLARWVIHHIPEHLTIYGSFPSSAGSFGSVPIAGEGGGLGALLSWEFSSAATVSISMRSLWGTEAGPKGTTYRKDNASLQVDVRM